MEQRSAAWHEMRKKFKLKLQGSHRIVDLIGLKTGHLIVLCFAYQKNKKSYWNCRCDCGNEKIICGLSLTRGLTKSCGCLTDSGSELFKNRAKERLISKIKISRSGCWEWQGGLTGDGYGQFRLHGLKIQRAHRASWRLHCGEIPENKLVLHKCDNKICVNPDHLYVGTTQENTRDAIERGLMDSGPNPKKAQIGERNCKAKLSEQEVKNIRKIHNFPNISVLKTARKYCVNESTIRNILKRKTWNHI